MQGLETIGSFLRQLRQQRACSLGQLSLWSGVTKATLSRWETGQNMPRIPQLMRVLETLDASPAARTSCLHLLNAPRALYAARGEDGEPLQLSLGDALYGLRQRAGQTQAQIARTVGVSRALYGQWETGDGLPTPSQIHAVGFALGASAEETAALGSRSFTRTPVEKNRDALLRHYMETMGWWGEEMTSEVYEMHLLSLLANFGHLVKMGKADVGDIALIITNMGDSAALWHNDAKRQAIYQNRALQLAKQSREPLHFHLIPAIQTSLLAPSARRPSKERVAAALEWQPRFKDKAGQAYLLSFIAKAIAKESPDEALRLADTYCALVSDNPDEYPCRLRDRGNLLLKCGRPAESVAFIANLQPQDALRESLKQLEMAEGLITLGSFDEARNCVAAARRGAAAHYGLIQTKINEVEHAVS